MKRKKEAAGGKLDIIKLQGELEPEEAQLNDLELMMLIQPRGGISFKNEAYIRKGDGYEGILHIYKYQTEAVYHWLYPITHIESAVTAIDISTIDVNEAKKNINKSMSEQDSRWKDARKKGQKLDAEKVYQDLEQMYIEMNSLGEVMKLIDTRIFVYAKTRHELEERIEKIQADLNGRNYKVGVYLGETRTEWGSLYRTYTQQQKLRNRREGQPILSEPLALGHPFHGNSLLDGYGSFYGTTGTGGGVVWDMFHLSRQRTQFNGCIVGDMGSGKSTMIKKMIRDRAARGDIVRIFDPKGGEYEKLINELGGRIIALDGSEGMLNPLEVFRTAENEAVSFSAYISKAAKIYRQLNPHGDPNEVRLFQSILRDVCKSKGLAADGREVRCTGYPPECYPIFSDVLEAVRHRLYSDCSGHIIWDNLGADERRRLGNIEIVVDNLIMNYGRIFNGYTSISNLMDEQIILFDVSNLKNMSDEIYDVQMFTALSLCWGNLLHVGVRQKLLYDERSISAAEAAKYLIMIDEAHRLVNTNKIPIVEFLIDFERMARAFFGGLWLASQNIRDYAPEGSGNIEIGKIKTLFALTQYKLLMKQGSSDIGTLRSIFPGQLTEGELEAIPKLEQGEAIMCISGDRNIQFRISRSKEEERLFAGGAGAGGGKQ